jgi:uncharacterized membrane protein
MKLYPYVLILTVLALLIDSFKLAIAIPYRSGDKCSSSGIDIDLVTGQTRHIYMPPDPSCYQGQSSQQKVGLSSYQFRFTNNCSRPVQVALLYRNLNNYWETAGWWKFRPGEKVNLSNQNGLIVSKNRILYFYAETIDKNNKLVWKGKTYRTLNNEHLGFIEVRDTVGKNNDFSVECR